MVRILVVGFMGQYNHLIARTLREIGCFAELLQYNMVEGLSEEELRKYDAFVLGGGPYRVWRDGERLLPVVHKVLSLEVPVLGICLGHQLLAIALGGSAGPGERPEYGPVEIIVDEPDELFTGLPQRFLVWSSHWDEVKTLPPDSIRLAHSESCEVEAFKYLRKPYYGVQFHPEVYHTPLGPEIFKNFVKLVRR